MADKRQVSFQSSKFLTTTNQTRKPNGASEKRRGYALEAERRSTYLLRVLGSGCYYYYLRGDIQLRPNETFLMKALTNQATTRTGRRCQATPAFVSTLA